MNQEANEMSDVSVVSPSTQQLTTEVVRESVEFYSQFKGDLTADLRAPSSGTKYPSEPSDWRERMLALVGMIDA
jgi:hypothetical protein